MFCIFYNPKTELIEVIETKKVPASDTKFILKNANGGQYVFKDKSDAQKRLLKYHTHMVNPTHANTQRVLVTPLRFD